MKARLELLSLKKKKQAFLCYEVNVPAFPFVWHYHPEYELTYIIRGKGKRLVGDSYESFSEGDLILLGSHLPHTWVSDSSFKQRCRAVVIQFSDEFITPILGYTEMEDIRQLLKTSNRGLCFKLKKGNVLINEIEALKEKKKSTAFIALLQILSELSKIKSRALTSLLYQPIKGKTSEQRINKVFHYIQNNYKIGATIVEAAALVNLSESAFCKFFKRTSGKTFSEYVNEVKITNACTLLIETDTPISSIASQCGFLSLTYFNRVFIRKKKTTPRAFRQVAVSKKM